MTALKDGEIDISIALTEALITGIAKKVADFKIVGTYVTSPLNWAVIVGKDSGYEKIGDLRGEKIGISRIGRLVFFAWGGRGGEVLADARLRVVGVRLWLVIWDLERDGWMRRALLNLFSLRVESYVFRFWVTGC